MTRVKMNRNPRTQAYTYDGNGNRLTRTVGGATETYAYDDGDKLLAVSVGGTAVKTFGYDAAGRTTSVLTSAGLTTLAYDFEGRATSITGPGVSQTNAYNGLDTRVGSTTNSAPRTFLRDGATVTDPVLSDGAATYTPGVSERRGTATTFLHSGLKNALFQTGTAQTLAATRTYDAFGNVVSSTGTWRGPFGYAGAFGYQEDQTGLRLLGHRYYDSSTGRFLTRDPIKDGRNWYGYGAGESAPINGVDPDGQVIKVIAKIGLRWLIKEIRDEAIDEIRDAIEDTPAVIGEGGKRLDKYLQELGGDGFVIDGPWPSDDEAWRRNREWLKKHIDDGDTIVDVGEDPDREDRGRFYPREKALLRELIDDWID